MGRIGGHGGHSWVSRDYRDIDCQAVGCMMNREKKCMTPSACEIGEDGRCKGYVPRPQKKVEGD